MAAGEVATNPANGAEGLPFAGLSQAAEAATELRGQDRRLVPGIRRILPVTDQSSKDEASTYSILWQVSQSCEMVFPSFDLWLSSWHRKHPGESMCPMLLG